MVKQPKCKKGEILRDGYHRKGYTRKDGTKVSAADVPSTCIKDRGAKGKGPKILPEPDPDIHLSEYGYRVHESKTNRRAALRDAAEDMGALPVLRRLNLIRNYQAIPDIKDTMSEDVRYMSNLYAKEKKQKGGDVVEERYDVKEICESDGVCHVKKTVYEKHVVDDKEVVFESLTADHVDEINAYAPVADKSILRKRLEKDHYIGIKINGKLCGFFNYIDEPNYDNNKKVAFIVDFKADPSSSAILGVFMNKYFKKNHYDTAFVRIMMDDIHAVKEINLWYALGFHVAKINKETHEIFMERTE